MKKSLFKLLLLLPTLLVAQQSAFCNSPLPKSTSVVLNTPVTSNTYVSAYKTITMQPGFSVTGGIKFSATVDSKVVLATANLSADQNYVATYTPKEEMKYLSKLNCDLNKVAVNVTYYDGLGRPMQKVAVAGSSLGNDIIVPIEYDDFGREARKNLPYVGSSSTGVYDVAQKVNLLAFYNDINRVQEKTTKPFSETVFDGSPLNRVVKQGAPGEAWQPVDGSNTDNTVKYDYATNSAKEVLRFTVNLANGNLECSQYHVIP